MNLNLTREDIDSDAFTTMMREALIDDLKTLEEFEDNPPLSEAYRRVIAYYSVPGTYLDGKYDS